MQDHDIHQTQHDADDKAKVGAERPVTPDATMKTEVIEEDGEVFRNQPGQADFRALGWYVPWQWLLMSRTIIDLGYCDNRVRTSVILMKLCFATGVLAIPFAFGVVGYAPGIILLICWGSMTTCKPARILGCILLHLLTLDLQTMPTSCTPFE